MPQGHGRVVLSADPRCCLLPGTPFRVCALDECLGDTVMQEGSKPADPHARLPLSAGRSQVSIAKFTAQVFSDGTGVQQPQIQPCHTERERTCFKLNLVLLLPKLQDSQGTLGTVAAESSKTKPELGSIPESQLQNSAL